MVSEDRPPQPSSLAVNSDTPSDGQTRIRLVRGGAILFEADGFRLIEPRGLKRSPLHDYASLSHIYVTDRVLLIGTHRDLLSVRTKDFVEPTQGPKHVRDELLVRIEARPGGLAQREAMAEVDRLGERDGPTWMIWTMVALCLAGMAMQLRDPQIQEIGAFLPELFGRGEYWRAITSHFIHELSFAPDFVRALLPGVSSIPIHLSVNVAGMLVLGHLVERPMGSWRTSIVLTASGIGTIVGILIAGHVNVVGSSGLVSGLAGAMLGLELHYADSMPAFWRLPRRLFITVIVVQFLIIDQLFAGLLAGGAHLGGFVGGYASAWALGRPTLESIRPTAMQRFGSYCAAMLVTIGFLGAVPLARNDMVALERHAHRLWNTESALYLYEYENAAAWLLATEEGASPQGLQLAVGLADRAVANTQRLHPGVLDTLAEALFQNGDALGAVLTIEEAIRLQPWEPYFFEQWRRFTGDRAPDDRPPPPGAAPPIPYDGEERDRLPVDPEAARLTI